MTQNNVYSPISNSGLIKVAGNDAAKLLQGQTSCDFNKLEVSNHNLGTASTAQGRMYSSFRAIAVEDGFYLQMDQSIIETTLATLKKYAVFFKVALSDEKLNFHGIALYGEKIIKAVSDHLGLSLSDGQTSQNSQHGILVKINGQQAECWANPLSNKYEQLMELLESDYTIDQVDQWQQDQVEKGIAWIKAPLVEELVLQMTNFDLIGAVSFGKGCYTGQEIIARLHYLGKAKKRMLRVSTPVELNVGDKVFSKSKAVGLVVNAVNNQALISVSKADEYFADENLANSLKLLDLPYEIAEFTQ